ncbi:endonuclease/exonuclease/phosphatase, putative [Trypanosoma equiperdum]|uniref:Endonuclease/exonuclease/phosphatase, putative n=2 Tax=Trypanozoon TaxID=39700 RepID=Q384N6_TRYB2|nr:endonuclease/exonuclease/phosphatase, putative [Trypanosoma brucei brucei TREU927]EAN79745.1 endonuclease/exonuclease/phosphatase, putative [Trypanosoma brucei brucei TREU927]SCU71431.1 endonuclease/exonuclease/phosphatase, putative [Trypanosoma equiperdum]
MYTTMPNSPLAIPHHFLDIGKDESSPPMTRNDTNSSGLASFQPTDDQVAEGFPSLGVSTASPTHRTTLQERREKLLGGSFLSLCVETLQNDCPEAIEGDCNSNRTVFRGWSKTDLGVSSQALSNNGVVRLVCYNILAQRFLSMQRYPRCPPFALAEDYRCGFAEQELLQADPDIILLQEISVDVFGKPGLLGENLREKHGFIGNHVVVTDLSGRPRHTSFDSSTDGAQAVVFQEVTTSSSKPSPSGTVESRRSNDVAAEKTVEPPRSDLEGVATFFLKDRFELLEVIPIRLNEIANADKTLTQSERRSLRRMSHNVALITVLRDLNKPNVIYVVCNLHLLWSGSRCQLWQLHRVMSYIEQVKGEHESHIENSNGECPIVAVVLGGDFNSESWEPPIAYALNGSLPESSNVGAWCGTPGRETGAFSPISRDTDVDVENSKSGTPMVESPCGAGGGGTCSGFTAPAAGHSLALTDVYEIYRERHPRRVSFVDPGDGGKGKVYDHILIDKRHLGCTDVLRLSSSTNLPAPNCPSDHCPVGAVIVPLCLLS